MRFRQPSCYSRLRSSLDLAASIHQGSLRSARLIGAQGRSGGSLFGTGAFASVAYGFRRGRC